MRRALPLLIVCAATAAAGSGLADEGTITKGVAAVAIGVTGGTARLDRQSNEAQIIGPAGSVAFELNYALSEALHVGAYGSYSTYRLIGSASAWSGISLGAHAQLRFRHRHNFMPYVGLGAGYHGLLMFEEPNTRNVRDGFQLVRARAGFEFSVARYVRAGPQLGFDLTMFMSERSNISPTRFASTLAPFAFIGIAGSYEIVSDVPR